MLTEKQQPTTEPSHEDTVLLYMERAIETMHRGKPEERSELSRRYQIAITDLEKVIGYFETFVIQKKYWPNYE